MYNATITSKGQLTVPKQVREFLKIKTGDKVQFIIEQNGIVLVLPVTADVRELKGMIEKPKKPVSLKQMKQAVYQEGGKN